MGIKKRGISPVVATVLLIAMVIIIAIILFLWFKGMRGEAITKFGGENIDLVCPDVQINAEYSGGSLTISNVGNIPVFDFKMKIESRGGHKTEDLRDDYSSQWSSTGLNQGQVANIALSLDPETTRIVLIPVLIGNSETGKKTYVCKEKDGFEIAI